MINQDEWGSYRSFPGGIHSKSLGIEQIWVLDWNNPCWRIDSPGRIKFFNNQHTLGPKIGGGLKHVLCSSLFMEMIHFWRAYSSDWLTPPTRNALVGFEVRCFSCLSCLVSSPDPSNSVLLDKIHGRIAPPCPKAVQCSHCNELLG